MVMDTLGYEHGEHVCTSHVGIGAVCHSYGIQYPARFSSRFETIATNGGEQYAISDYRIIEIAYAHEYEKRKGKRTLWPRTSKARTRARHNGHGTVAVCIAHIHRLVLPIVTVPHPSY